MRGGEGAKEGDTKWEDGGAGALHWQRRTRWTRLNSGAIQAGGVQRGRHSVGRCRSFRRSRDTSRRTASGVRAA